MRVRVRQRQVILRLSDSEFDELEEKAKKSGLNKSVYLRRLIAGVRPREKPDAKFYKVLNDLGRIGTNINQIATIANTTQYINEKRLNATLKEIKTLRQMLIEKYLGDDY